MSFVTAVVAVHTEDADPDQAPYRLSDKAGHDSAQVTITVDAPTAVRAWLLREGGVSPLDGRRVAGEGAVCGLARCGRDGPLALAPGAQRVVTVAYAQADDGAGDGDKGFTIDAWGD